MIEDSVLQKLALNVGKLVTLVLSVKALNQMIVVLVVIGEDLEVETKEIILQINHLDQVVIMVVQALLIKEKMKIIKVQEGVMKDIADQTTVVGHLHMIDKVEVMVVVVQDNHNMVEVLEEIVNRMNVINVIKKVILRENALKLEVMIEEVVVDTVEIQVVNIKVVEEEMIEDHQIVMRIGDYKFSIEICIDSLINYRRVERECYVYVNGIAKSKQLIEEILFLKI